MAMPSQVRILYPPFGLRIAEIAIRNITEEILLEFGLQSAALGILYSVPVIPGLFGNSALVGGCSSMVEPQPSKLKTRVRFPSPAFLDRALLLMRFFECLRVG